MPSIEIAAGDVAAHGLVLTAGLEFIVTFADNIGPVDVVKDDGGAVYFTVDGSPATVGGSNCYLIPAGAMGVDTRTSWGSPDVVRLISDADPAAPVVSVQKG